MLSLSTIHLSKAVPTTVQPVVYVENAQAKYRDELIPINVKIANLSRTMMCIGLQFKLRFDADFLETNSESIVEGGFFKSYGSTLFLSYVEDNYVGVGVLLLPAESGGWSEPLPEGNGTIATITFKALYHFYDPTEPRSTALTLDDVILVNVEANEIPHIAKNGQVVFSIPTMTVDPQLYIANRKGETFAVNIDIQNVNSGWHMVGAEFKLQYNATLLELVSIAEGGFFKSYGSTLFLSYVEDNYVGVGVLLLPAESGGWSEPLPEGNGTIATITFKALYQPVEPSSVAFSNLTLSDTVITNDKAEGIPHSVVNGEYQVTAETFRPLDVQIEDGLIHFRGEIVDFHVLVTDYGKTVDPDQLHATLYFNGTVYADLSAKLERVSKGLYRIAYEIPAEAETGTYVLLVKAEYLHTYGANIGSFQISSTLTGWNALITDISDWTATIVIPYLREIKLNLTTINGRLIAIKNETATIYTSLGTLQTNVANLNVTVTKIDGDIATIQTTLGTLQGKIVTIEGDTATIKTDIGDIKADVSDINTKVTDVPSGVQTSVNLLYVTLIFALIAAIGAILAVIYTRKK
jgi:hypothetical protein